MSLQNLIYLIEQSISLRKVIAKTKTALMNVLTSE